MSCLGVLGSKVLKILSATSFEKCWGIMSAFNWFLSLMKSTIIASVDNSGWLTFLENSKFRIQLLLNIGTCLPFLIFHLNPLWSTGLPHNILLQTNKGLEPSFASIKLICLKYFAFNIFAIRESGLCEILHPYLAMRAWLKLEKSLNLTQCMHLWDSDGPRQNLVIAFSISLHRPWGILNALIAYAGTTYSTALMRTSFPFIRKALTLSAGQLTQNS